MLNYPYSRLPSIGPEKAIHAANRDIVRDALHTVEGRATIQRHSHLLAGDVPEVPQREDLVMGGLESEEEGDVTRESEVPALVAQQQREKEARHPDGGKDARREARKVKRTMLGVGVGV